MTQSSQPGSSSGNNGPLVEEKSAVIVGLVVTVVLGVPGAAFGLYTAAHLIGQLFWLAVIVYAAVMLVQFWATKAYKGGLTVSEVRRVVFWPVDWSKSFLAGGRTQQAMSAPKVGSSKKIADETVALGGGLVLSAVVGLLALIYVFTSLWSVIGGLIVVLAVAYFVGLLVHFWMKKVYLGGLTLAKLLVLVFWPRDVIQTIRAGVKKRFKRA